MGGIVSVPKVGAIGGKRTNAQHELLPENGRFVINFICATDVPKADLNSESDPYIRAWISVAVGEAPAYIRKSHIFKTAFKCNNKNPRWNCFRDFRVNPPVENCFLFIEIFDHNDFSKDDILGVAKIPLSMLQTTEIIKFPFEFRSYGNKERNKDFSITIRRVFIDHPPPKRKTIFLLRHAQSKWNEAEAKRNVRGLLANDHSLTVKGIEQVQHLNSVWSSGADSSSAGTTASGDNKGEDPWSRIKRQLDMESFMKERRRDEFIRMFLSADRIYCSPLTRAVQSCLVALKGHQALKNHGITFASVIREVKNVGGMDTVGFCLDRQIISRVQAEFEKDVGPERATEYMNISEGKPVAVDFNDTYDQWWTSQVRFEDENEQQGRVREFLSFERYNDSRTSIYVGHSLFFKAFYSKRVAKAFHQKHEELAAKMLRWKLDNAALIAITVEFFDSGQETEAIILDAELMFGTNFREHKRGKGRASQEARSAAVSDYESSMQSAVMIDGMSGVSNKMVRSAKSEARSRSDARSERLNDLKSEKIMRGSNVLDEPKQFLEADS